MSDSSPTASALRPRLADALKEAMKDKDTRTVSTVRLIIAALKDRDICARSEGRQEPISDAEVLAMLQTMVRQRQEAIALYEQGGRLELAQEEQEEIEVISRFLPEQLPDEQVDRIVESIISELDAHSLRDMGRTMATLKARYPGQMDFAKASCVVRRHLA